MKQLVESLESRSLFSVSLSGTETIQFESVNLTATYSLEADGGSLSASATVTGTIAGRTVDFSRVFIRP